MATQLAPPGPLYSWAQPTVAANWTAAMLERLPDDGWLYELVEGRVVRMPPPGPITATSRGPLPGPSASTLKPTAWATSTSVRWAGT